MTIRRSAIVTGLGLVFCLGSHAPAGGPSGDAAELGFGIWGLGDDGISGFLEVTWSWTDGDLAGFQFDLTGVNIIDVQGGLAEEYDFTVAFSDTTVLGFFSTLDGYIPPTDGPEVLVEVYFELANNDDTIRMEDVVCSDPNAQAIDVVHDDVIDPYGQSCCGDINLDGTVDGSDLTTLLGQWGSIGSGDLNDDGTIDGSDLTLLLGCWGPCP